MHTSQRLTLLFGLAASLHAVTADAITIARVTRRGYILVDETGVWAENIPVSNTRDTAEFIGEVTTALINVEGFHEGQFLAAMQIPSTQSPLAFYLPIRNDIRGIGQRSSLDGRSEVFDTNAFFNTAFQLDGFVYLNSYRFYTDPRAVIFGRFLICTQEFGHRFGAHAAVNPFPIGSPDAGDPDASVDASTSPDVSPPDVPPTDVPRDVAADASDASGDGGADASGPMPLARDALLGRGNQTMAGTVTNRAHWSYFFHTGGSPMEGNNWTELSPGNFRTDRPTFRFSPLDLYFMGLIPPSEVPPTFLIAEPQNVPRNVTRDSAPEYYNRQVTLRGRRVDISVQDIIRANGARNPAYPSTTRNLDVVWVLLASAEDVNDELAAEFDEAVDSCALGYSFATAERSLLVTTVPGGDAGAEDVSPVEPDAGALEDVSKRPDVDLGDVPNIPPPDGMTAPDGSVARVTPAHAEGGCACSTTGASHAPNRGWLVAGVAFAALVRRRRVKGARRSSSPAQRGGPRP